MSASLVRNFGGRKAEDAFWEWIKRRSKVLYFQACRESLNVLWGRQGTLEFAFITGCQCRADSFGRPAKARLVRSEYMLEESCLAMCKAMTKYD